jgi:thiamine pyrophosphokinase
MAAGVVPHVIVGDMDSASTVALESGAEIWRDEDQQATDCDKLLTLARTRGHEQITLIGVEGDRLDHLLATLSSCLVSPLSIRFALRGGMGFLLGPGNYEFSTAAGRRISLLPLPRAVGSLQGVAWPLESEELSLGSRVSISNRATGPGIVASLESGAALLTVEMPLEEMPQWPD